MTHFVSLACADVYHRPEGMMPSKIKYHESTLWQRRYWEHAIGTETDFSHCMDYIDSNPVKHHHVDEVTD